MKLNGGQIAGILIVVGSLGLITYQATRSESTVTFYTPAEVYANPMKFEGKLFRVSGLVLRGSKTWESQTNDLKFQITDLEGHNFNVHYKGIPPDLFKEGQGVVVEGKLISKSGILQKDNLIQANLLMVKHSEVYDTKEDHSKLKEVKLLDSILKDQKLAGTQINKPVQSN
ncbi:cytochrome c maturation protein CcmE [Fluviispira multicolorata]|uniref:Cytochrome c maturation protein CcmE n=1 Tax=Fluviispira multicolorata TaxID=2654512 RepID=A0A833JCL2_9BACT|nr:cytochrome c maturation protein CcmE [Fluviispira multicolorata]KAB8030627.1 cytochrome c maturation protein CcmE [Fluviispira multicolorata]